MFLVNSIAKYQIYLLSSFGSQPAPGSEGAPDALVSTAAPRESCYWHWDGIQSHWVCGDEIFNFSIKNDCNRRLKVGVMYWFANNDAVGWIIKWYDFAPGELGYLFDTENRHVYIDAQTNDGGNVINWPEEGCWAATNGKLCGFEVDMGGEWVDFTQHLTC